MRKSGIVLGVLALVILALFSGCSTLSVKAPRDFYLSMGDYTPAIRTEGIVQVHKTVWTPFIVLYDASKVREGLYKALLEKTASMEKADGIIDVTFYSKPSALCVLAPFTVGIGIWIDYYAEGVVITRH
ncbi:MAG: hypothetical protein WCL50_04350 [Spirochaetota bacterium]